jgi:hypothetical protein
MSLDRDLRSLKSKLQQIAVDARRAPARVLGAYSPHQRLQLCLNLRFSYAAPLRR